MLKGNETQALLSKYEGSEMQIKEQTELENPHVHIYGKYRTYRRGLERKIH